MKIRPRSVAAAAAALMTAAVLATTAQPSAAVQPTAPAGAVPAPAIPDSNDYTMGSQIRIHEGTAHEPTAGFQLAAGIQGIDVSAYQPSINWGAQWNAGKRFAWVKATQSTNYVNPIFGAQYNGSYGAGFTRGAYHFAYPSQSSGAAQANYFLAHGGGWSADGRTLPGALDMEYQPGGRPACYGLSQNAMSLWIKDFSDTYHARTSKWPAIYTSTSWWNQCVDGDFSRANPLWVARYNSTVGALPRFWGFYTVWQYSTSNNTLDLDVFNGSAAQLAAFATNHD